MAVIRAISYPMSLTFHRAFDICTTPLHEAIDHIISLGCDRLLTSGRSLSAFDSTGLQCLHSIMRYLSYKRQLKYPGYYTTGHSLYHLQVIAASGVKTTNVREIILSTGVNGVHTGSGVVNKSLNESFLINNPENSELKNSFNDIGMGIADEDLTADFVEVALQSWSEIRQCPEEKKSDEI